MAKPEIEVLHKRIVWAQEKIKALVREEKFLDDIKQAMGLPAEEIPWRSLAEVIYLELTE